MDLGGCGAAGRKHVFVAIGGGYSELYAFDTQKEVWLDDIDDIPSYSEKAGALAYEANGSRLFAVTDELSPGDTQYLYIYRFASTEGCEGWWEETPTALPDTVGPGVSLAFRPDPDPNSLISGWLYLLVGNGCTDFYGRVFSKLDTTPDGLNRGEEQGEGMDQLLDWKPTGRNCSYRVQVSSASDFSSVLLERAVPQGELRVPRGRLLRGNTYYWRVRMQRGNLAGPWSAAYRLVITDRNAPPAVASYPPDSAVIAGDEPVFDWPSVADAVGYELRLTTAAGAVALDTVVIASEYVGAAPIQRGRYTWTTRALMPDGSTGDWAESRSLESDYGWTQLEGFPANVGVGGTMCYAPPMADQDVPERVYALRGEDAVSFRGYDISANEWERLEGTRTVNAGSIVTYERNPNWLYAILADDEEYAWYYDRDRDDWESQTEVPLPRPCSSGSALANVDRVLYLAVAGEYSTGTTNFYTQTLDRDGGGGQSAGATHPHDGRTLVWLQSGGGIALRYRAQGQLEAAIHDLSGRSVRTLRQMASASGLTELYWDARDQTGTRVSPGVYFISAQDAEGLCRAKVTLP